MTTREAAAELGVTTRRVIALITAGRLKARRVQTQRGPVYIIRIADLEAVRIRKAGRPKKEERSQ